MKTENKAFASADSFDQVREKWKLLLCGADGLNTEDPDIKEKLGRITEKARENWETLDRSPQRSALWKDLSDLNSAYVTAAYRRIYSMALAWAAQGSGLYHQKELADDIRMALDWMCMHKYNGDWYKDWWDWQIGAPIALNDCVTLMYEVLSGKQVADYMARVKGYMGDPAQDKGANRSWKCKIYALYGVLMKDGSKLERARDCFASLFADVDFDEGFYADGSFIQHHDHPYNLGYGINLLADIGDFLYLLDGSPWEVNDPGRENVFRWVHRSYEPFIYRGLAMDMVRGREMARFFMEDNTAGAAVMSAIVRLVPLAPPGQREGLKGMLQEWLQGETLNCFYRNAVLLDTIAQAKKILRDRTVSPRGALITCRYYPAMDRAVLLRQGYGVGLSMHSSRIANYEADIKNENLKGWHTGDGMLYLYNDDLSQYNHNFWPTVDSHRLPGTTVLGETPLESDKKSGTDWVGGVVLKDLYGVFGMEYEAYGYTLRARKSWFFFDNEVVALGAGIESEDDRPVETIVENRKLRESCESLFITDAESHPALFGQAKRLPDTRWAHLAAGQPGADIGYYFPQGVDLNVLEETRTDCWNSINGNPASDNPVPYTERYLTLWLDHGRNPKKDTYEYVLLPGMSAKQTASYAASPKITVLRNDDQVQAVREDALKIIGACFWTDGLQTVDCITCDGKACVMLQIQDSELEISVSDPTQLNTGGIRLTFDIRAGALKYKDPAVTVERMGDQLALTVKTDGYKGASLKACFYR